MFQSSSADEEQFSQQFFGKSSRAILDEIYNVAYVNICDAYDHVEEWAIHQIGKDPTINKEDLKEISRLIRDAVQKLANQSILILGHQSDLLEKAAMERCFNMPQIPPDCRDSYCKLVTSDITLLSANKEDALVFFDDGLSTSDNEIIEVLTEIHKVQQDINQSHEEMVQGIVQGRSLLHERQEIMRSLNYYAQHNKKLESVQQQLMHLSMSLEQTVNSLIKHAQHLHRQYNSTKKAFEEQFAVQDQESIFSQGGIFDDQSSSFTESNKSSQQSETSKKSSKN
ncbi:hypothetical protein FDP41_001911 [Naegleria fowleri]|uniref:Uncharacterized protein n=1 Tax=Naegleria fowleri TaxID=5763 RepID=A0A6A5BWK1_NAEFO|nr:uncharacterized protein FDP41_001911 [Naegleria fowleri]KAF0978841.1 hypothetical protein FDP41_001911 [Naegleria fowleri]CAG4717352.1 unnamed protein product [Naegleria fowleri]